jgi:hypothetical protein
MKSTAAQIHTMASTVRRQPERDDSVSRGFPTDRAGVSNDMHAHSGLPMRMFTEEEVASMLQVSLSQLRKWRMKRNRDNTPGDHFKKIGRLVRYPGKALQSYIDGE